MKNFTLTLCIFILLTLQLFAQKPQLIAESNPLETALYLLTIDKNTSKGFEELANVFFEVGEYEKTLKCLEFESDDSSKIYLLSQYSNKLLEKNKLKATNMFLDEALKLLKNIEDSEWQEFFVHSMSYSLTKLGREKDALEIYSRQDVYLYKMSVLNNIGQAFLEKGDKTKALYYYNKSSKFLKKDSEGWSEAMQIGKAFVILDLPTKAFEIAKDLEKTLDSTEDNLNQLFAVSSIYLKLGKVEETELLWRKHSDLDYFGNVNLLAELLFDSGNSHRALKYLHKIASSNNALKTNDADLVKRFIQVKDIEFAKTLALNMSIENDDYQQQMALIAVADSYIKTSEKSEALKILDFAFQKAKKIEYLHLTEQSIGASPGSRKEIYLKNIYERLMQLGEYEIALQTLYVINSNHSLAKEFLAERLVDFASRQIDVLPKKEIDKILAEATEIAGNDEDYFLINFKLQFAEFYLKQKSKDKSVDLIAEVLSMAKDSCCSQDDFLLKAGKLFTIHNLKANQKLKNILRKIIKEETN